MKRIWFLSLGLVLILSNPIARAAQEGALDAGLVNPGSVEKPAWFKNSFLDLREDLAEANRAEKRLILYFYQDGCPYCEKLINTNFAQRNIRDFTVEHFDLVAINMWGDSEVTDFLGSETTEKEFSLGLKVQFTPTLLFLNEQGEVALRVNGYYPPHKFLAALNYVEQRLEGTERFSDYFTRLNPVAASGRLHIEPEYLQPPYDLSKRDNKPLLILAEQRECPVCDEFHREAFQRKESRELLEKFSVAVIDIWSKEALTTPEGRRTSERQWAQQLKLQYAPGLIFFDRSGAEVFRTEAYLRPFHLQSALDYVASGAYITEPEFQRFVQDRADSMRARGIEVDIWR